MIKVAMCQMCANGSLEENINKMTEMVEKAVAGYKELDLICFAEYCYGLPEVVGKQPKEGPHTQAMAELAKKHGVYILAGSFAEQAANGKAYNTALCFDRAGRLVGDYQKTHLMMAMGFDESLAVEAGNRLTVFDTDFGKVGLMVCYDLRFPEVARTMVLEGAELLLVPSCFPAGKPLPPRTDHWDILTRATALQNITYTIAVNQFGHLGEEIPFGRSSVINPWGTVISQCGEGEEIAYAELDLEYQRQVREKLASWNNRRPELYSL